MPDEQQNQNAEPQRPQIFSDQFIEQIGEDLANQIVDQLCSGLTQGSPPPQPATSLCLEIIIFDLDEEILRELVHCVFRQFNPILLTQQIMIILQQVNQLFNTHQPLANSQNDPKEEGDDPPEGESNGQSDEESDDQSDEETNDQSDEESEEEWDDELEKMSTYIQTSPTSAEVEEELAELQVNKFELLELVNKKIRQLKTETIERCHLRDAIFEKILLRPRQLPSDKLSDIYFVTEHVLIQEFRTFLTKQYDNFALKLCNKISCLNSDIEFLSSQIKQVTINYPAGEKGIIEIADAAASVALAFFSEEDDFDEIFDAVDSVTKLIEELSCLYKTKLCQLEEFLSLAPVGCPLPIKARESLPTIPEVPPPPPIFPVVGLPTSTSISPLLPGL